jgi:ferredoxin
MDAVIGMEGAGPSGGTPRHIGAVLASADPVGLDVVAAAITGFDPMDVYTNAAAHRRGLGPKTADEVPTAGVPWRSVAPDSFAHPARDVSRSMPPGLQKWVRARVVSRPWLEHPDRCTGCRACERDCPVHAIRMVEGLPSYDYEACIRCYCCQEMCPSRAVGLKRPWFVRALVARGGSEHA